ncbi:DHBP synthase RibB-like alpha/beta domain-containing protein [Phycomyces blakesleeanus]|uniref:Threonylcarbamoyl-AMP synthase n=1 Tax=Phycomyces blakesleeanus TaxID=4837 RepID=A0ABR3AT46_PHYBL
MFTTAVYAVDPSHFVPSFSLEETNGTLITHPTDKAAIDEAVQWLKRGEAIGIPTETVYGLAANALSADAVSKIYSAKNRPQDNPLIVHVSSLSMLRDLLPNRIVPEIYLLVIKKCWPGPLTIILPTSDLIPSSVTCNQPTVAIRFPSHPVARALIEGCGFPLAAPSANSSGKPSPTLASHVFDDLQGRIPMILDGGSCNVGVESTVLDGLRNPPAILRPGGVTYETLRSIPGMEKLQVYRKDFVDSALEQAPTTPGMKYRHYSPEAKVILMERDSETKESEPEFRRNFEQMWKDEVKTAQQTFGNPIKRIGILRTTGQDENEQWEEVKMTTDGVECVILQMGRLGHPDQVARGMFKALRELDSRSVDLIFVEGVSESQEGMAVMNRLRKAASKVIETTTPNRA